MAYEAQRFDVNERLAATKARLSDRLSELSRRLEYAREEIRPSHVLQRPWVMFSIAAAVGYWLGQRGGHKALPVRAGEYKEPQQQGSFLAHALKHLALTAATAATRRAISRIGSSDDH